MVQVLLSTQVGFTVQQWGILKVILWLGDLRDSLFPKEQTVSPWIWIERGQALTKNAQHRCRRIKRRKIPKIEEKKNKSHYRAVS